MDKIRVEALESLLPTLPEVPETGFNGHMFKQEHLELDHDSSNSISPNGYTNGHHHPNNILTDCSNGGNSAGSDMRKLLEPVDESRLTDLMNTYKSLNRTEQILFLLRIQTNGNSGNRSSELVETSNWLRANFTVDSQVAIPKEEVYQMYKKSTKLTKPVSTADFGKIVRQVFPEVKPRRLGQRGNSRYCYANIRKKQNPDVPTLPMIEAVCNDKESTASKILNWARKRFCKNFESLEEFSAVMENMPDIIPQHQSQQASQTKRKRSGSSCSVSSQNLLQDKVPTPRLKREDSYTSDDPELQTYFSTTDEKWPNLRRLLTASNPGGSATQFTPIQFRPPSAAAALPSSALNGNGCGSSKKKRHYSTATVTHQSSSAFLPAITPRSQSVPLNSMDNPFEDEFGGDSGIGSLSSTPRNPMLSSVSNEILKPNDNLIFNPNSSNPQDHLDDQLLDGLSTDFEPVFDYDEAINEFDTAFRV